MRTYLLQPRSAPSQWASAAGQMNVVSHSSFVDLDFQFEKEASELCAWDGFRVVNPSHCAGSAEEFAMALHA